MVLPKAVPSTDKGIKNLSLSHRNYNYKKVELTTQQKTIILDNVAERILLKNKSKENIIKVWLNSTGNDMIELEPTEEFSLDLEVLYVMAQTVEGEAKLLIVGTRR